MNPRPRSVPGWGLVIAFAIIVIAPPITVMRLLRAHVDVPSCVAQCSERRLSFARLSERKGASMCICRDRDGNETSYVARQIADNRLIDWFARVGAILGGVVIPLLGFAWFVRRWYPEP